MGESVSPDRRDTSTPPDWALALLEDVGDIRDRVSRIEGIGAALVFVMTIALGVVAVLNK